MPKATAPKASDAEGTASYSVKGMRVIMPSAKVAERNADLAFTVKGTFLDSKGNVLTITSKQLTREQVKHPAFALDVKAGTLTIPAGQRGRPESAGASEEDILAALAAIRGE